MSTEDPDSMPVLDYHLSAEEKAARLRAAPGVRHAVALSNEEYLAFLQQEAQNIAKINWQICQATLAMFTTYYDASTETFHHDLGGQLKMQQDYGMPVIKELDYIGVPGETAYEKSEYQALNFALGVIATHDDDLELRITRYLRDLTPEPAPPAPRRSLRTSLKHWTLRSTQWITASLRRFLQFLFHSK